MSQSAAEIQQKWKDIIFRRDLLEAILSASREDDRAIPTEPEFVFTELINGSVRYVGGIVELVHSLLFVPNNKLYAEGYKLFQDQVLKTRHINGQEITPLLKRCLAKTLKPEDCSSHTDRVFIAEELRDFLISSGFGIVKTFGRSTYSLPLREIPLTLTDDEKRDIEGIGKAMKPFMDRDLAYIRENYSW